MVNGVTNSFSALFGVIALDRGFGHYTDRLHREPIKYLGFLNPFIIGLIKIFFNLMYVNY